MEEDEHNPIDESKTNEMCYDIKISSIVLKILPTFHVPSNIVYNISIKI